VLRKLDSRRALARRLASVFVLGAVLVVALPAQAQEPLTFFKNYFVTGDYTVRGVSLWRKGVNGTAVVQIPPLAVPRNTDILAAFLYVQTAESVEGSGIEHAKFAGFDLGPYVDPILGTAGSGTYAKPLVAWQNAQTPCWSVNVPGGRRLMTYRVDVLRFLPVDSETGKYNLSAPLALTVPDAGRLFADDDESCKETIRSPLPRALGASLLVVYRDPTMPLSAIVIYDGAYTKRALATMVQPIRGFYQASNSAPSAKMTHIVGDGQLLLSEQVLLGTKLVAKNPYIGADGPKWDDHTFSNLPLPGGAGSTTVTVDRNGLLSDCVTFSAMVFRTTVQDSDGDGLLDVWENQKSTSPPLLDPHGNPLPNLGDMGASPDHKDLFVEIAYMDAAEGTTYGGVAKPEHTHLPGEDALKMAAESFDKSDIRVHFDIGANYQGPGFPDLPPLDACLSDATWTARCAIIPAGPAGLAKGGKRMSETAMCPQLDPGGNVIPGAPPIECVAQGGGQGDIPGQYPKYPGTVGWKTGFQMLRDAILGFDYARKDIFHYVLFAHSVGIPVEPCQTTDASGNLVSDFTCQDTNPSFHVPRTNSGIADFPGGDVLVTLGAFDDDKGQPVGTQFMQGSTLMHELGHNFELTHGGPGSLDPTVPREPNCKPHYLSVMNYLYQLRGLPDSEGILRMDYSAEVIDGVNESVLSDGFLTPIGAPRYRPGWYAPFDTSYLKGFLKAAKKHCDGSDLLATDIPMVRVDAPGVDTKMDWNADGSVDSAGVPLHPGLQDINFDGIFEPLKPGANDWAHVHLNQLGGRRNVGGYYFVPPDLYAVGPLSLDVGRGDIGRGDIGRGDIGRGDIGRGDIGRGDIGIPIGRGDIGRGDIGRGDIGRGDIGRGDIGRGDIGRGDIGRGDIGRGAFGGGDLDIGGANEPIGELDLATAVAVSGNDPSSPPSSPATQLTACRTLLSGEFSYACVTEGGNTPIRLDWLAPHLGQAQSYSIYRFVVDPNPEAVFPPAILPTTPIANLSGGDGAPPDTTYLDFEPPPGVVVAYFVIANFGGGISGGISNFARVTTPALGGNGSVRGTIVDAQGAVLPGITVSIRNDSTLVPNSVVTTGAGVFFFPSLPPGNYTITSPANVTRGFTLAPGQALDLGNVGPTAGFAVTGQMFYSAGGVAGATIRLHPGNPAAPAQLVSATNADGYYAFASVPSGTYYPSWEAPTGQNYLAGEWVDGIALVVGTTDATWNSDIPQVLTLLSPANGAQAAGCSPSLSWTSNPDATMYTVEVHQTSTWALVVNATVAPQVGSTVIYGLSTNLTYGVSYTWLVKAYSGNHWVGATPAPYFTFIAGSCAPVH